MKTLTWKVDKTVPTQCPDYVPDPYTGQYPSYHCAVYHCKTVTEERTAEFATLKEAQQFADKAPLSCYDFKLNGKLLKDKRKHPTTITFQNSEGLTAMAGTTTFIMNNGTYTNEK